MEACAQLLAETGYGALTTNHIADAAGVSIGSLYEYFGDKDAIVYEVVRRTTEAFFEDAVRPLAALEGAPIEDAVRTWLWTLLEAMQRREALLRAIADQVPAAASEPHRREAFARHLMLARAVYEGAGDQVRQDRAREASFLLVTLVDAALTKLVLEPPGDVDLDRVMDELIERVIAWVAP